MAARSKAWNVFVRSNTGVVGSNPSREMDVCVRLFCVCVVLFIGLRNWKSGQGLKKGCRAIDNDDDDDIEDWTLWQLLLLIKPISG
jgi:hypothetical protein